MLILLQNDTVSVGPMVEGYDSLVELLSFCVDPALGSVKNLPDRSHSESKHDDDDACADT
jgi:hypothetical protein